MTSSCSDHVGVVSRNSRGGAVFKGQTYSLFPSAPMKKRLAGAFPASLCIWLGAEGETRTPTGQPQLDPEPSASTSSATSALTA
jgi:hypothetical protein